MKYLVAFTVFLLAESTLLAQSGVSETVQKESGILAKSDLEPRLKLAGENRTELEKALSEAPEEHRKAISFLIQNMRRDDLQSLSSEFLLENVKLAYSARETFPWSKEVPEEVFFNDVLPYANVDEKRENWRAKLLAIASPIVKDCKTTEEAAQALNQHLFKTVTVKYSTKRKKANQAPGESMDQGLASCTGLSILLVDACRSVNVPARVVGIPRWTNKPGNHTWVEVWSEGDWHFTGAAEYNAKGLDRAWFTKSAALADKNKRLNSIYAVSFARTSTVFPTVWSLDRENWVYAVNVTDRYTKGSIPEAKPEDQIAVRFRVWNAGRKERIAVPVEVLNAKDQTSIASGKSTGNEADMNDMYEVPLKKNTEYQVRIGTGDQAQTVSIKTAKEEMMMLEIEIKHERNQN